MGHDWDDGNIKEKISILAKNLKTEESKCTFVNFLADYLPQNEKTARGQDAKSMQDMAILANNFKSPKLKCAFAEVIAFRYSHPRKRLINIDDEKLKYAKKRKLQDTESLWQCDECDRKLSNKANLIRHLKIHTKNSKTKIQSDIKKAKDKIRKGTVTEKKYTNTPKNKEKQNSVKSDSITSKNTENQKASVKPDSNYKCSLCSKVCKSDGLYKHYGEDHNIDCPEEILVKNGNVLVYSDRQTEGGEAPWFIDQRKKFFDHYQEGTCKFCDGLVLDNLNMLMHHYIADVTMQGHKVDPSRLEVINHIFRAERTAHLAGNIPQKKPLNTPRKNTGNNTEKNTNIKIKIPLKRLQGFNDKHGVKANIKEQTSKRAKSKDLLMYVCGCGVATENYDSAVEHSQRHLLNCSAVTQTCDKCEFKFEAACYAEHTARHQKNDVSHDDFIQLKYDFAKLQSSNWFDMLKDLSPVKKDQIMSASIYKYTRNVKLNAKAIAGMPVYQCARCQLCIHPKKVENHCNNGKICLKLKRSGHICPECGLEFHSDKVLKAHKGAHKIGAPRLIMFNSKDDVIFNRALLKLEYIRTSTENVETPDKVTRATAERNVQKPKINVISDSPVNKLCQKCNKYVNYNDYKAHTANHEEEKSRSEIELNQEPCLNNVGRGDHGNDIGNENIHSEEHENRQQENDSDSSQSVGHEVVVVNALVHEGEKHQEVALVTDMPEDTEHTRYHEENIDKTPEQLMLNLFDGVRSQTPLGIDEETQCTQELLITLGENAQERNSPDLFVDDSVQENELNKTSNGPHQAESDATTADTNNKTGSKEERLSVRDQLRMMLPEDDSIEDDSIEDFEELNVKISQLICSRD